MKQPEELAIGGARKTLPTGKARKVQKGTRPVLRKKSGRARNILNQDAAEELIQVFGQK